MLVVRFHSFYEYLLVPFEGRLILPPTLPQRYATRVESESQGIVGVKSLASAPARIQKDDILRGNGVWIVSDDCSLRGATLTLPGIRQFLGIPIDEVAALTILRHGSTGSTKKSSPLALYHGTASENVDRILASSIQLSASGMLGPAVYAGTLWKAVRFATLTQDYAHRSGALIRILVFPQTILEFPRDGWKCTCEKCAGNRAATIADHAGLWSKVADCAHVKCCEAVKNEEWALSRECRFVVTHAALVDASTLAGPHHDPYYRGAQIL